MVLSFRLIIEPILSMKVRPIIVQGRGVGGAGGGGCSPGQRTLIVCTEQVDGHKIPSSSHCVHNVMHFQEQYRVLDHHFAEFP